MKHILNIVVEGAVTVTEQFKVLERVISGKVLGNLVSTGNRANGVRLDEPRIE